MSGLHFSSALTIRSAWFDSGPLHDTIRSPRTRPPSALPGRSQCRPRYSRLHQGVLDRMIPDTRPTNDTLQGRPVEVVERIRRGGSLGKAGYTHSMQAPSQPIQSLNDEETILGELAAKGNLDDIIPQLARDRQAMHRIESVVRSLKTAHDLIWGDARAASALADHSI